jgi:hypothetical protein
MKKIGYYHIYLTDDYGTWAGIMLEQFKIMQEKGIFDYLDEFRVTMVVKQTTWASHRAVKLVELYFPRAQFNFLISPYNNDDEMLAQWGSTGSMEFSENKTMKHIWDSANKEDAIFLYCHSKGVTAPLQYLRYGDVIRYNSYHYWRAFLNWGVLEKWKDCVDILSKADIAGVNFFETPAPHFSGNFWWSKSSYLKTLPDPATKEWWHELRAKTTDQWLKTAPDRFSDEMWVLSQPGVKVYSSMNLDKPTNLGQEYLSRNVYAP